MKVAVSIPDQLFRETERLARRCGVSRSQLYARALVRLLQEEQQDEVTARLDVVYANEDSAFTPDLAAEQRRALGDRG